MIPKHALWVSLSLSAALSATPGAAARVDAIAQAVFDIESRPLFDRNFCEFVPHDPICTAFPTGNVTVEYVGFEVVDLDFDRTAATVRAVSDDAGQVAVQQSGTVWITNTDPVFSFQVSGLIDLAASVVITPGGFFDPGFPESSVRASVSLAEDGEEFDFTFRGATASQPFPSETFEPPYRDDLFDGEFTTIDVNIALAPGQMLTLDYASSAEAFAPDPLAPVPLPGAGWLLVAALAAPVCLRTAFR